MDNSLAKDSANHTLLSNMLCILLLVMLPGAVYAEQNFRNRAHIDLNQQQTASDIHMEVKFGRNVAARILARYPLHKNTALNRYVNLIGKALSLHSSRTEIDYYFAVIDAPHANAYSTPGGYIFITRTAIEQMNSEAELAAVLAHEIAHITQRHIVKELNIRANDASATAGIARIVGGSGNTTQALFNQVVDKAVNILFEEGYKQQDELESDRVAIELTSALGYDPHALADYLSRLQHETTTQADNATMTHPPTPVRLQNLASLIEAMDLTHHALINATDRFSHYATLSE